MLSQIFGHTVVWKQILNAKPITRKAIFANKYFVKKKENYGTYNNLDYPIIYSALYIYVKNDSTGGNDL